MELAEHEIRYRERKIENDEKARQFKIDNLKDR